MVKHIFTSGIETSYPFPVLYSFFLIVFTYENYNQSIIKRKQNHCVHL